MSARDKGNVDIALYMDLSKAYDFVSHDILLEKLSAYGIRNLETLEKKY